MEQSIKKSWYYKSWFVVPMLLIFFPIGAALMWIGNRYSSKTRIVLSIAFGLFFAAALFHTPSPSVQTANTEQRAAPTQQVKEDGSLPTPTPTTIKKRTPIGVSYDDIMSNGLDKFFKMKPAAKVDGYERMMGESIKSRAAILEITGNKSNISQALLMFAVPAGGSSELLIENSLIMLLFLKKTIPDYETSDWAAAAIKKIDSNPENKGESIVVGNKRLEINKGAGDLGLIILKVESKDNAQTEE